jgi:hypothetical protein
VKIFLAMVMKSDLAKTYNRVRWFYLGLILVHTGMSMQVLNWIMGCLSSTSFVVLINGPTFKFCFPLEGLRQGFPMSRFLFLLVVQGLSRMVNYSKREGTSINGILSLCPIYFL